MTGVELFGLPAPLLLKLQLKLRAIRSRAVNYWLGMLTAT